MVTKESQIEQSLIDKLIDLKYDYRPDIRSKETLENNFREKFEALNRVHLTDSEFSRLKEKIISPDVYAAAKILREQNSFERDDGTPLYYTLVNIKDWCKNSFEFINQLRINTESSFHQNRGNGYIWHTTGSGKTLTSFKASTLLKDNDDIAKCLFVVDRKDLDRQTREEFNKFQEGCVEENTNTESMVQRMLSNDYADKVIVTTIQKLGLALDGTNKQKYKERLEPLRNQRIVFIFDECHRSQFGENHKAIKE